MELNNAKKLNWKNCTKFLLFCMKCKIMNKTLISYLTVSLYSCNSFSSKFVSGRKSQKDQLV